MAVILAALLVGVAAIAAAPEAADPALESLQGTWRGRDTGNLKSVWTLRVKDRQFRFDGPGSREWYEGNLVLHEGSPLRIDLQILRCDCTYKESTSLGLYSIDGDRLTLIGAEPGYPRPEALETGGRTILMNLHRLD